MQLTRCQISVTQISTDALDKSNFSSCKNWHAAPWAKHPQFLKYDFTRIVSFFHQKKPHSTSNKKVLLTPRFAAFWSGLAKWVFGIGTPESLKWERRNDSLKIFRETIMEFSAKFRARTIQAKCIEMKVALLFGLSQQFQCSSQQ